MKNENQEVLSVSSENSLNWPPMTSTFNYYSPNFHRWTHDARDLVEKAKRKWLAPVMKKAS